MGPRSQRKLARLAEADCKQRALGSGATATLMASTVNKRFEPDAATHEQGADAFGRVNLVTGDGQEIDAKLIDIGRNLADGLGSVGVKQDSVLACNAGAIHDRLDGADLVVGMHDADKDRARCDRPAEIIGVDPACAVDRQIGHPCAKAFEKPAGFDDRWVLNPCGDDVIALVAKCEEYALECQGCWLRFRRS